MGKAMIKTGITILLLALLLAAGNKGLIGIRQRAEEEYLQTTLSQLMPGSTDFTLAETAEEEEIIKAVYQGETGYVIHTVTQGYVDEIELLVGVDTKGTVKALSVLGQQETFGLGAKSQREATFLQQYLGTAGEAETGSTVDALTGATVTSKAITKGVNAAVAYVTGADISSGATSWGG